MAWPILIGNSQESSDGYQIISIIWEIPISAYSVDKKDGPTKKEGRCCCSSRHKGGGEDDEGTTSSGSKEELDASLFQLLQDQQNKDAVSTLLKASVCILVLPLLTLFLVYRIDWILGLPLEETQKTTLAAVASVIVVNLVIVAFVIAAWREK